MTDTANTDTDQTLQKLLDECVGILDGHATLGEARQIPKQALEGLYRLAHQRYGQGKFGDAEKVFELLCLYDHIEAKHWCGLGYARQQLKDYGGAIAALSYARTIAKEPDPQLYFNFATCLLMMGENDAAKILLTEMQQQKLSSELAGQVEAMLAHIDK
ncbi:MAG: tetratricopeptide repeat protein [Gammaproteobacteria bacterium]